MAEPILNAAEQREVQRRMDEDASGQGSKVGVTGGFKVSASSFKSLWNAITGKGETDAKLEVGLIDMPRTGDAAIAKLEEHYQKEQSRRDAPKDDNSHPVIMSKETHAKMEASIARAREAAKEHGLQDRARDGGHSSTTASYAHNAPKNNEHARPKAETVASR